MNQARLVVEGRGDWVYTHIIGASGARIGRGPGNDVELNDFHASSQHAVIEPRGDEYILSDAGSRNGTFLNGKRLQGEAVLRNGDRLRVGITDMSFLTESEDSFYSLDAAGVDAESIPQPIEPSAREVEQSEGDSPPTTELRRELDEAKETIRVLRVVMEFTRVIAAKTTTLQKVEAALKFMVVQLSGENGFIMQISSKTGKWSVRARYGDILDWTCAQAEGEPIELPMSLTVVERVIRTGEPVVSLRTMKDPRFDAAKSIQSLGIQSCMCVPLLHGAKPAGVTYVDRRLNAEPFGDWERKLFAALSEQLTRLLYPRER